MNKKITESKIQQAIVEYFEANVNRHVAFSLLHSIPNGVRVSIGLAMKLKREGLKRGVPDLFLAYPRGRYHGMYLELKKDSSSKASKSQKMWIEKLREQGYYVIVAHGYIEAVKYFEDYIFQNKYK